MVIANIAAKKMTMDKPDSVIISWETAEYLSVLIGQVPLGNQKRRSAAAADICNSMMGRRCETTLECFQDASWEITSVPKGTQIKKKVKMEVQTHNKSNGVGHFPSIKDAMEAAVLDPTVCKISFSLPNGEPIRLVRAKEGIGWVVESIK
jgi:hypothetical protein